MCRDVRYCPSPVRGESLTRKSMLKVGSSISMRGKATAFSGSAMVSPISTDPSPTMATMSPASASSTSVRPSLSKTITLSIEPPTVLIAGLHQHGLLPAFHAARHDAADGDPPHVFRKVERRAQHPERAVGVDDRARVRGR